MAPPKARRPSQLLRLLSTGEAASIHRRLCSSRDRRKARFTLSGIALTRPTALIVRTAPTDLIHRAATFATRVLHRRSRANADRVRRWTAPRKQSQGAAPRHSGNRAKIRTLLGRKARSACHEPPPRSNQSRRPLSRRLHQRLLRRHHLRATSMIRGNGSKCRA